MEARSVDEIPVGDDWQYEPKWDGFRCIAFPDGDKILLRQCTMDQVAHREGKSLALL